MLTVRSLVFFVFAFKQKNLFVQLAQFRLTYLIEMRLKASAYYNVTKRHEQVRIF